MVTRQDVKIIRKFLNNNKSGNINISVDELNAIDNMCADYEFKYKM